MNIRSSEDSSKCPCIKTIFFDLGNVLVFFSHAKMLTQIAICTGLTLQQIQELLLEKKLRENYEAGTIGDEKLYELFKHLSPNSFTPSQFYYAVSDIFTPNDLIYPIVYALKAKGLRLILLSNTSPAHFSFIANRFPILHSFDAKILSYEVGACKPHPNIFHAALNAANCSPQECFYTDDIPEYIEQAKCYQIDAEVFLDVPTLKTHLSKRFLL